MSFEMQRLRTDLEFFVLDVVVLKLFFAVEARNPECPLLVMLEAGALVSCLLSQLKMGIVGETGSLYFSSRIYETVF